MKNTAVFTLCSCTILLEIQSPNPDPPGQFDSHYAIPIIAYDPEILTSSLELALVELRELAEDSLLVFGRETHSGIDHLHTKQAHCIHAELVENIQREKREYPEREKSSRWAL
jgi:hypothetical protein